MLFAKVSLKKAQQAKKMFIAAGVLEQSYPVRKNDGYAYFPVREAIPGFEYHEENVAPKRQNPKTLKEALASVLPDKALDALIASYDLVGSIAIIEIPDELARYEEQIAAAVLETHKAVTTVLKKVGIHGGEFRTQNYECVAGIDTRETIVKESGCVFLVDVEAVYYSVRLSTERLRIATLIGPDERVLVLGSGVGVYPIVLAKHSIAAATVGVEKNPVGQRYALANVEQNKLKRVHVYEGDAQDLAWLGAHEALVDRVIIPIPASPKPFELAAFAMLKPEATMHTYHFAAEHELPIVQQELLERFAAVGWHAHVTRAVKAGHHKPFVYRWCLDVELRKKI
jgi:tRNA (guanine37-N1)-methyltransferase